MAQKLGNDTVASWNKIDAPDENLEVNSKRDCGGTDAVKGVARRMSLHQPANATRVHSYHEEVMLRTIQADLIHWRGALIGRYDLGWLVFVLFLSY